MIRNSQELPESRGGLSPLSLIGGSLLLGYSPQRLRLFRARQIPQRLRTPESLLKPSPLLTYLLIAYLLLVTTIILGGMAITTGSLWGGLLWDFSPRALLLALPFLLGTYLFWCLDGVYGAGRAKTLRYAYYAGQHTAEIRTLSALDSQKMRSIGECKTGQRHLPLLPVRYDVLLTALLLLAFLLAGVFYDVRLYFLLVPGVLALGGVLLLWWRRRAAGRRLVVSASPELQDIVSHAFTLYPEPEVPSTRGNPTHYSGS